MGINLEYVTLLSSLHQRKSLPIQGKVLEFGAQVISADTQAIATHLRRCGIEHSFTTIDSASLLYDIFGMPAYTCIDATSEQGALAYDLNTNLRMTYGFADQFDLVTDLGTFEHCFNVASTFCNAHEACKVGGLIIHALPANCNANHGYYTIQPRLIADLAIANNYDIIDFVFTVDYSPILYQFNLANYRVFDDRDLMIYVVLRKKTEAEFQFPFDSIFTDKNTLLNYQRLYPSKEFSSYIKGSWSNIQPNSIDKVPIKIKPVPPRYRIWFKQMIDHLGNVL